MTERYTDRGRHTPLAQADRCRHAQFVLKVLQRTELDQGHHRVEVVQLHTGHICMGSRSVIQFSLQQFHLAALTVSLTCTTASDNILPMG